MTSSIVLWLFVMNLGIAFGAGIYEHRIVVARWLASTSGSDSGWNAEAARQDDPGRRFWVFISTLPLTFLTLANLFVAWRAAGTVRGWWLAAGIAALADRVLTFSYFIPTMVGLMASSESPESAAIAARWSHLNYLRHAIVLAAWLAAMQAFAVWHQHSSYDVSTSEGFAEPARRIGK
jgi:hypothetical protein